MKQKINKWLLKWLPQTAGAGCKAFIWLLSVITIIAMCAGGSWLLGLCWRMLKLGAGIK